MVLGMHSATRGSFLSGLNMCMGHVTSISIFPLGLCINKWLKDTGTQTEMSLQPNMRVYGGGVIVRCVVMGLQEAETSVSLLETNPLQDTSSIGRDCKACESPTETGTPHQSIPTAQGTAGHVSTCLASGGSRQIFGLGSVLGDGQHSP